jgi:hypothetical protein
MQRLRSVGRWCEGRSGRLDCPSPHLPGRSEKGGAEDAHYSFGNGATVGCADDIGGMMGGVA